MLVRGRLLTMMNDDRCQEIDQVVRDVARRQRAGENVATRSIVEEFPHLAPELVDRLDALHALEAARRDHAASSVEPDESIDFDLQELSEKLPDYEVHERIHEGGQGVVYRATHRSTKRFVAIKVLLHGIFSSREQRHRFLREAQLASRLEHASIVTVFDSGVVKGFPYVVMEFVDGLAIDDYVIWHDTSLQERIRLLVQVCAAVEHAHLRGVLHRDLKPSNILIDQNGRARILDFGLAKDLYEESQEEATLVTAAGAVVGTLPYLSPEQARGDRVLDLRSDVYSLGVVLFKVLTDTFPYQTADDVVTVRDRIIHAEPASLRRTLLAKSNWSGTLRALGKDLDAILRKSLEKDPGQRYQSAGVLGDDLRHLLAGDAISARAANHFYILAKTARRFRIPITVGAVFLILIGGAVGIGARLLFDRQAAQATGDLRVALERHVNMDLLNALQANDGVAAILNPLLEQSSTSLSAQFRRLQNPSLTSHQLLDAIAAGMPENLLAWAMSSGAEERERASVWLRSVDTQLDTVSAVLTERSLVFPFDAERGFVLVNDLPRTEAASKVCDSFLARAYGHLAHSDVRSALRDLTTARNLAHDLSVTATFVHRGRGTLLRARTYAFVQQALTKPIDQDQGMRTELTQWILNDPEMVGLSSALHHAAMTVRQLLTVSTVSDGRGGEFLDLHLLDRNTNGILRMMGVFEGASVARSRLLNSPVDTLLDEFVMFSLNWENLPYGDLDRSIDERQVFLDRAVLEHAWLYLLPDFSLVYRQQLVASASRRASRLAAWVHRYRNTYAAWPLTLQAAVPENAVNDLADPLTGADFELVIDDNHISIRSVFPEKPAKALLLGNAIRATNAHWVSPTCLSYSPAQP